MMVLYSPDLDKTTDLRDAYLETAKVKQATKKAEENYRIRNLTERECFRFMGVKDEDFERVAKNQTKGSLYHLAGDSIVVDVLMAIFREMLCD